MPVAGGTPQGVAAEVDPPQDDRSQDDRSQGDRSQGADAG
jgi:hypothetical protein